MKCPSSIRDGESALVAYVAGHVRGQGAIQLAAHIRDCRACADFVSAQRNVWDLLDEFEPAPVSMGFERRLYELAGPRKPRWSVPMTAAAVLVGLIPFLPIPFSELPLRDQVPSAASYASPVTPLDAEQLNKTFEDLQLLQQLDIKDETPSAM